jgi:membrane protein DedA with SNARE-associated domain
MVADLVAWITAVLDSTGHGGIIFLIALENIFPPLPSEIILPLTGFLVQQGKLSFIGAVIASTLGSVLGALFLYFLSYKLGQKRVFAFADKYGKFLGLSKGDIKKSIVWFHKHGGKLVFFGRIIPTIRSVVSIPAGLAQMDLKKFIFYTALGSAIWNGVLIWIGMILGERWHEIQKYTKTLEYIVWALLIGGIIWLVWRKQKQTRT